MAFLFKTSKLRPYKACKSLADTPISQKLANILTGLAYLQGAPICTTEIHSAESGWLVGTTCVYLSFTLLYTSKINLNMILILLAYNKFLKIWQIPAHCCFKFNCLQDNVMPCKMLNILQYLMKQPEMHNTYDFIAQ